MGKIGIIGHFGFGKSMLNGQTIKTKILYKELCGFYNEEDIVCLDTHGRGAGSRIKLLLKTILLMLTTPKIIILLAKDGKKTFFPLLYWLNKIFKRDIYHDVIAGNLYELLQTYPNWKKYLNSFKVNWVELESVCTKLKNAGITNVEYLPNFKRVNIIDKDIMKKSSKPFKFCTFSRVSKQKGIEDAIQVIIDINSQYDYPIAYLDIYGQVEKNYVEEFNDLCNTFPEEIKYKGEVEYFKSSDVLKDYFMLLFPTKHNSEGFPGTIIDAYSAGVPVIASNNSELVENNFTGLTYSGFNKEQLKEKIIYAIENNIEIDRMKERCVDKAWEYHPDKLVCSIIAKLEESQ